MLAHREGTVEGVNEDKTEHGERTGYQRDQEKTMGEC